MHRLLLLLLLLLLLHMKLPRATTYHLRPRREACAAARWKAAGCVEELAARRATTAAEWHLAHWRPRMAEPRARRAARAAARAAAAAAAARMTAVWVTAVLMHHGHWPAVA